MLLTGESLQLANYNVLLTGESLVSVVQEDRNEDHDGEEGGVACESSDYRH